MYEKISIKALVKLATRYITTATSLQSLDKALTIKPAHTHDELTPQQSCSPVTCHDIESHCEPERELSIRLRFAVTGEYAK